MRRPLVLDDSRHPFRRSLAARGVALPPPPRERDAVKLFCLSFTAFFICFYTFLL